MSVFTKLASPFPTEAIHWRSQQVFERDNKHSALALAYIDARDVMDRLDAVCGPHGWQDSYIETPKGRVICSLSIQVNDQWISKSDGAGDTAVEGEKGGISDAFKRAGVKWGIGRYLYAIGNTYAPCEANKRGDKLYFKKWKPEAEKIFSDALAKVAPAILVNDADWALIVQLIDATNTDTAKLCDAYGVASLKALTASQAVDAIAKLNAKLAKGA